MASAHAGKEAISVIGDGSIFKSANYHPLIYDDARDINIEQVLISERLFGRWWKNDC
jgi:hypothetical protein